MSSAPNNVSEANDGFFDNDDDDDEEDELWRQRSRLDLPAEYFQIEKLLKYAKTSNQSATVLSLSSLRDFDLEDVVCQMAILEHDGVKLLLNILDTKDERCKVASLNILKPISLTSRFCKLIIHLDGVRSLVDVLSDQVCRVRVLGADTLANLSRNPRACFKVIQHSGIKPLVSLLNLECISQLCIGIGLQNISKKESLEVARSGCVALAVLSRNVRTRWFIHEAGLVAYVANMMTTSVTSTVLIPALDTLQQCASENYFRVSILQQGMLIQFVSLLRDAQDTGLLTHCASIIQKCAEDSTFRTEVRLEDGLRPLALTASKCDSPTTKENQRLLAAALTGAIWKCTICEKENVAELQKLNIVELLIKILERETDEEILCNVTGALAECVTNDVQRRIVSTKRVIPRLIELLRRTHCQLLINDVNILAKCCLTVENMNQIEENDGIRYLWSLLKHDQPDVQSATALALHTCIEQTPCAAELVRNFVGGLELLVGLMDSPHLNVQASVCGVIAAVAKDVDNLAVITDNGVVSKLAHLAENAEVDSRLQRYLAEAVANCCALESNATAFGKENAVEPLIMFLKSSDDMVQRMTVKALALLSRHPDNCRVLLYHDAVKMLLVLIASSEPEIQEDAAMALGNIRRYASSMIHDLTSD